MIKIKKKNFILVFILLFIVIFMLISPKMSIDACFNGLRVWATTLVPALFPFFFITKILGEMDMLRGLGKKLSPITQKLFNVPGEAGYVWLMAIVSGYPVGAKITADLYENGIISKGQACRITSFTSTSGPLFIVGSVGVGMFVNQRVGLIMLISHIIGATLNGLLYRKYYLNEQINVKPNFNTKNNENMLENCMLASIKSVLIVGGYVCFFFMIITIINQCGLFEPINIFISRLFNVNYSTISSITNGIIEVTKGCFDLSKVGLSPTSLAIIGTGLISFGGISIFLQALTFLKRFKISTSYYICIKVTQTIISCIIAWILCLFLF